MTGGTQNIRAVRGAPVGRGDRIFMIVLTLFEIGASIFVVSYVKNHGGSDFSAYLWSLLPPVVGAAVYWAKTRDVSGASMAILAFNLLSAAVAFVGSHDSHVLLYKDCFVTGIIGLIFAVSLLMSRPLTFWFGQRLASGGTPEGLAWWDGLWANPRFQSLQRRISVLWAVIMLAEALAKAVAISRNSFETAYAYTQILPLVATAVGVVLTFAMARHWRRAAHRPVD